MPQKKYKIIYADPPWSYDDNTEHGGAEKYYSTMDNADLSSLEVQDLADNDCTLFMWATMPLLPDAFELFSWWGFTYKTCAFAWVKGNRSFDPNQYSFLPYESLDDFMGLGRWTRGNVELCLLGVRGKPEKVSESVRQIVYTPIQGHSRKPPEVRDRIVELMGDVPRIELFAREKVLGWDAWGLEVESDIKMEG